MFQAFLRKLFVTLGMVRFKTLGSIFKPLTAFLNQFLKLFWILFTKPFGSFFELLASFLNQFLELLRIFLAQFSEFFLHVRFSLAHLFPKSGWVLLLERTKLGNPILNIALRHIFGKHIN